MLHIESCPLISGTRQVLVNIVVEDLISVISNTTGKKILILERDKEIFFIY